MQSRPVSARDYCEKASPDVAILKKENERGKRNIHSWKQMGGNGVRFHIFWSYNHSKENIRKEGSSVLPHPGTFYDFCLQIIMRNCLILEHCIHTFLRSVNSWIENVVMTKKHFLKTSFLPSLLKQCNKQCNKCKGNAKERSGKGFWLLLPLYKYYSLA